MSDPVRRDDWGVPHIDADNEPDAWFGLGFCHGQDRTFQLEVLLRIIRGTLAELIGGEHLERERVRVSRRRRGDVAELEEPRAGDVSGVVLRLLAYMEKDELRVVQLRCEPVTRDEESNLCCNNRKQVLAAIRVGALPQSPAVSF